MMAQTKENVLSLIQEYSDQIKSFGVTRLNMSLSALEYLHHILDETEYLTRQDERIEP